MYVFFKKALENQIKNDAVYFTATPHKKSTCGVVLLFKFLRLSPAKIQRTASDCSETVPLLVALSFSSSMSKGYLTSACKSDWKMLPDPR